MVEESVATLKDLESGEVFPLGRVTRIGRAKDNDVVLSTGSVSKWHCRIEIEEEENNCDAAVLFDVGSRNGTFIGSNRVGPKQDAALPHRAFVRFGSDQRRFQFDLMRPPVCSEVPEAESDAGMSTHGTDVPVTVAFLDAQGVQKHTTGAPATASRGTASGSTLPGLLEDIGMSQQTDFGEGSEGILQDNDAPKAPIPAEESGDSNSPFPNLIYSPSPEQESNTDNGDERDASDKLRSSWMDLDGADAARKSSEVNPFRGSMQWADPSVHEELQPPPLPDVNDLPAMGSGLKPPTGDERARLLEERKRAGEYIRRVNEALSGLCEVQTVSFHFERTTITPGIDMRSRELRRCVLRLWKQQKEAYFRRWAWTRFADIVKKREADAKVEEDKHQETSQNELRPHILALHLCERRIRHRVMHSAIVRWFSAIVSDQRRTGEEVEERLTQMQEQFQKVVHEKLEVESELERVKKNLDDVLLVPKPLPTISKSTASVPSGDAAERKSSHAKTAAPSARTSNAGERKGVVLQPSLAQVVLRQKNEIEELRRRVVRTEESPSTEIAAGCENTDSSRKGWSSRSEAIQALSQSLHFERSANAAETANLVRIARMKEQKIGQLYDHLGQIAGLWIAQGQRPSNEDSTDSLSRTDAKPPEARRLARRRASHLLVMELKHQRKEASDQLSALRSDFKRLKERFSEEVLQAARDTKGARAESE